MDILSTVENLRNRLSYDDAPAINNALQASLQTATVSLSMMLRTSFARQDYLDIFSIRAMVRQGSQPAAYLRLKAGFLTADPTSILWGSQVSEITSGGGTDLRSVGNGSVVIDRRTGTIAVHDIEMSNSYVSVEYSAGFETDKEGVYQNVPEWLIDAVEVLAIVFLDTHYPGFRGERPGDLAALKMRRQQVGLDIQPYVRYVPSAEFPISTLIKG